MVRVTEQCTIDLASRWTKDRKFSFFLIVYKLNIIPYRT